MTNIQKGLDVSVDRLRMKPTDTEDMKGSENIGNYRCGVCLGDLSDTFYHKEVFTKLTDLSIMAIMWGIGTKLD